MGRKNIKARKRDIRQPIEVTVDPTPEQMAKGAKPCFVVHVDTWTTTKAHRVSNVLDQWFEQRAPGFDDGARAAIEWCQVRWEAWGVIGRQCANYSPTVGSGGGDVARDVELRDELDEIRAMFPPDYWAIFEGVCRWGLNAGVAGSSMANNRPQAVAKAQAIVGLIANVIAMERRL
jgi:hypothetical protein